MTFEYPERVRFVCERCAVCCGDTKDRNRTILLLEIEAEHIARQTSRTSDVFAETIVGFAPYVYRMKKTDDGKCVFLKGNVCSIYHVRPLVCRFYPFQLDGRNGRQKFTYTGECPGVGNGPQMRRGFYGRLFKESLRLMSENDREINENRSR